MIKITFPDGKSREYDACKAGEIVKSLSQGLYKNAVCVEHNGKLLDLESIIDTDGNFKVYTFEDDIGKDVYHHTTSHIMAQAVKRLYPTAKVAIGPSIKNGFYYDIEFDHEITQEDLPKIEAEMAKIVKEDLPLVRHEVSKPDAIEMFGKEHEDYKVLLLNDLDVASVSTYTQGEYTDMCRGPHLSSTGKVKAFKLLSLAGAYWRGNVNNKMLSRIYGTSFDKKADLDSYINMLEEAKKRDHRKLGKELELYDIYEEGPGFPFFLPKGMLLRNLLVDFWRQEHRKAGYKEISTPLILNKELWLRSGHWDHYKDNMYTLKIDEQDYAVKPMNCPGCMLVYKHKPRSYRDLPERIAEMGVVHRHELSGALHGLMRVRCFTQDDAHLFMTEEQIVDELMGVVNLIDRIYGVFGFHYKMEVSTKPENSMGTDEQWETATNMLIEALNRLGKGYKINEGDGAFYGPKIDFHLEDSLGRTWQCGTVQLDFQMPERFDLTYIGADGEKHRPVMIHRTALGSIERFIAIITEHFAGAFPTWLAPTQVIVLPISENTVEYAKQVAKQLEEADIRVETDLRNEKIGYRIREAQLQKVPYMLVVGDKESQDGVVAVRQRKKGDLGVSSISDFIKLIKEEVASKIM
ncbi:MAG: threonine--tRNA ligase [Clostridia bacterium]